jgi:ElaB/YqjD/DUF883 family membrane-anchored ribosome-binding protein
MKPMLVAALAVACALGQPTPPKSSPAKPEASKPVAAKGQSRAGTVVNAGNCSPVLIGNETSEKIEIVFKEGSCPSGVDTKALERQLNAMLREMRGNQQQVKAMIAQLQQMMQGVGQPAAMSAESLQKMYESYIKQIRDVYKQYGLVAGMSADGKPTDITVTVHPYQNGQYMIQQTRPISGYKTQYSTDGTNFADLAYSQAVTPGAGGKLILRAVDSTGAEILRVDKSKEITGQLLQGFKDALARLNRSDTSTGGAWRSDVWGCTLFGCYFMEQAKDAVCNSAVTKVQLSDLPTKFGVELDRSSCNNPGAGHFPSVCANFPYLPFTIKPGQPVYARFALADGSSHVEKIPVASYILGQLTMVSANQHLLDVSKWTVLPPVNPASGPMPVALGAFVADRTYFGFYVFSGIHGCPGQATLLSEISNDGWFFDEDGNGLVRQKAPGPSFRFGPSGHDEITPAAAEALLAKPLRISIAADTTQQKRLGPYNFMLDAKALLLAASQQQKPAQVRCEPGRNRRSFWCTAANPLAWIGIKGVRFGPKPGSWTENIAIDYTPSKFLAKQNMTPHPTDDEAPTHMLRFDLMDRNVFLFKVPAEWPDVFYQIVRENGTESEIERLKVPPPVR